MRHYEALVAMAALAAMGPRPFIVRDERRFDGTGFVGKGRHRAYSKDDARARRNRIKRWRKKKGVK